MQKNFPKIKFLKKIFFWRQKKLKNVFKIFWDILFFFFSQNGILFIIHYSFI
jgi:hypothetical protein